MRVLFHVAVNSRELMILICRICPGRRFAEASLSIMIASVLHTLTIEREVDQVGHPILTEVKMTDGVIS